MRAFVLAGTHSGCGKTTVTLGLLAALRRKGLSVQPFKAGPDFIDSGIHRLAAGRTSRNLDVWMCGDAYVRDCFQRHAVPADISIVEGVMGLYDGNPGTARLAETLDIPVVLVVDAYGMAESAAPLVQGFRDWGTGRGDCRVTIKGVIFNRVASESHYRRLAQSVKAVDVLGYLPRDAHFHIPHRHLGLLVAEEAPMSDAEIEELAETVTRHIDLSAVLDLSLRGNPASQAPLRGPAVPVRPDRTARIAIASDKAFCFYYPDNIELLDEEGCEAIFFSPLSDSRLPDDIDAVYIGGGYPELYAGRLSANTTMRASIKDWAESGRPLYAECGGLVYLSRSIADFDHRPFKMAAVFPFETSMTEKRAYLGYREIILKDTCILGRAGESMRGHEFHYSKITEGQHTGTRPAYDVKNSAGNALAPEGHLYRNTLASYIHIHFGSNPATARSFIDFIRQGRDS
jgi:cobyrinic acid a,c-diamide synthase